jgi:glutamate/aspartate transport system substrate-binding protein
MTPNLRRLLRSLLLVFLAAGEALAQAPLQESPTLKKIGETGVIVVGYRISSIPFSYLDENLKPIGYSVDLCRQIVEAIASALQRPSLTIRFMALTAATRIPLVANGTVDLECGVTTNTLSRQNSLSFTVTTFIAQSRLLSKKTSHIRNLTDLRGKTVVSTVGTTSISLLNEVNHSRKLQMKIFAGKDDDDSFQMVESDRATAFAMDDVLLYSLVANSQSLEKFSISEEALSVEPYAIALTREDPKFKKLVDSVLRGIFKSGEIHSIYRKWFQTPIPPKGINLQLPMSTALQRAIATPSDAADPKLYQ